MRKNRDKGAYKVFKLKCAKLFSLGICLIGVMVFIKSDSYTILVEKNVKINTNNNITVNLDVVEDDDYYIEVSGWSIKQGESIVNPNPNVVLRNEGTGVLYTFETDVILRNDITKHFNDGNNYDYSGFHLNIGKLHLPKKGEYEICFYYKNDGEEAFVFTGEKITI